MKASTHKGGITAPKGFLASGIHAGIKASPHLDLALILSECEGPIAGVFTKSTLPAAPVILDKKKLKARIGQAIIINSGNANACTGAQGLLDAHAMSAATAQVLGISPQVVFVGSTGIIGHPLPMERIRSAIPALVHQACKNGHIQAAQAIMTTDTGYKEAAVQFPLGKHLVHIGGMAKGSGMIHPDMATMLAYLTTDTAIEPQALQQSLHLAVQQSFNCISVDGDTSTNDTVLLLANGMAGNPVLRKDTKAMTQFQEALNSICRILALKICRDGEGLTKVVLVQVHGAQSNLAAKKVARTIVTSPLVKTAFFGEDPNWGRIMAAIGRAEVPLHPKSIDLFFNHVPVVKNGVGLGSNFISRAKRVMQRSEFTISVNLGKGPGSYQFWTTDLSYDYVKINTAYPT